MPSRCGLSTPISARGRDASLEVSDVSREFPLVSVLKFSMSVRQVDTLRYKIGCRLPRLLRRAHVRTAVAAIEIARQQAGRGTRGAADLLEIGFGDAGEVIVDDH